jgi:hypothetical protein
MVYVHTVLVLTTTVDSDRGTASMKHYGNKKRGQNIIHTTKDVCEQVVKMME